MDEKKENNHNSHFLKRIFFSKEKRKEALNMRKNSLVDCSDCERFMTKNACIDCPYKKHN